MRIEGGMDKGRPGYDEATFERAVAWFVALQDENCDDSRRARFRRWLDRHESHAEAYAAAEALWGSLDRMKSAPIPGLAAAESAPSKSWPAARSRTLALLLLAVAGGWWLDYRVPSVVYATGVGQRQSIVLADGSQLALNARSRLAVKTTWCRRQLELQAGEAMFTVAHEPFRPFVVRAGGLQIRDIGTRFDVRLLADGTSVSVLEGEVVLKPDNAWLGDSLKAGFSRRMDLNGRLQAETAGDIERAEAWINGRLVFERTPLAEVAAELEMHHDVQFVFADAALAQTTLSGTFEAGDLKPFLRALETMLPLRAERRQRQIVLSRR